MSITKTEIENRWYNAFEGYRLTELGKAGSYKEVWIKTDSFGRDEFARSGRVLMLPETDASPFKGLRCPAEVVREGAYWSVEGLSGYNVLVAVKIPTTWNAEQAVVG